MMIGPRQTNGDGYLPMSFLLNLYTKGWGTLSVCQSFVSRISLIPPPPS